MLDSSPELLKLIDNMGANPELADIVKPVIEETLKKQRMIGVNIGFQGCLLTVVEKLKKCKTVDEAIEYFQAEADKLRDEMSIPEVKENQG